MGWFLRRLVGVPVLSPLLSGHTLSHTLSLSPPVSCHSEDIPGLGLCHCRQVILPEKSQLASVK